MIGFVLEQGLITLPGCRERAHNLPLSLFLIGIQRYMPLSITQSLSVLATPIVASDQAAESVGGQLMKPLPLEEQPLFKGQAVAQGKSFEELAAAEICGVLQMPDARFAEIETAMCVLFARLD
jgi:hypothetical protein